MIALRRSHERGHADHGWLNAHHTFSFADYHDPAHMGFSVLRVINDDVIAPAAGFGRHPHRDMEIVTYILEGALRHEDSMGNGSVIEAGDAQYMSAGTGVLHSEFNASGTAPVRLLQIWILPAQRRVEPRYAQKSFPMEGKRGRWQVIASPDGREDSLAIRQDAAILATVLQTGESLEFRPQAGRCCYLQLARGSMKLNDILLEAGDGAAVSGDERLVLTGQGEGELLLFDLPDTGDY